MSAVSGHPGHSLLGSMGKSCIHSTNPLTQIGHCFVTLMVLVRFEPTCHVHHGTTFCNHILRFQENALKVNLFWNRGLACCGGSLDSGSPGSQRQTNCHTCIFQFPFQGESSFHLETNYPLCLFCCFSVCLLYLEGIQMFVGIHLLLHQQNFED